MGPTAELEDRVGLTPPKAVDLFWPPQHFLRMQDVAASMLCLQDKGTRESREDTGRALRKRLQTLASSLPP